MKRMAACTLGTLLTLSLATATAGAGDRHAAWPSDASFVVFEPGAVVRTDAVVAPGTRIYYVSDDPTYDLSGSGRTLYLVGDGGAYRSDSWNAPVAFVRAGASPGSVISLPAEYRQDWNAVAAGDRPVRCLTPVRISAPTAPDSYSPTSETSDYDRYRNGTATYTSNGSRAAYKKHAAHRKSRAAMAAQRRYQPAKRHYYSTTEFAPAATGQEQYVVAEATVERVGNDLFQIGNSWYTIQDGDWCRSDSWRGPFVEVKKGTVPREVIASAKHSSRRAAHVTMGADDEEKD